MRWKGHDTGGELRLLVIMIVVAKKFLGYANLLRVFSRVCWKKQVVLKRGFMKKIYNSD